MLLLTILATSTILPTDIAGVVAAVCGLIIGIITARRRSKSEKLRNDQVSRSSLLEGYGQIVKDLQEEIGRIRKQYTEDLDSWNKEKDKLEGENTTLLNQLNILHEQISPKVQNRKRRNVNHDEETNSQD